jgi:hypothetical protein
MQKRRALLLVFNCEPPRSGICKTHPVTYFNTKICAFYKIPPAHAVQYIPGRHSGLSICDFGGDMPLSKLVYSTHFEFGITQSHHARRTWSTKPRRICRRSKYSGNGTELSAFHRYSTKSLQIYDPKLRSVCCCFLNTLTQKAEQNWYTSFTNLISPQLKIFMGAVYGRSRNIKQYRSSLRIRETKSTDIPNTESSFGIMPDQA